MTPPNILVVLTDQQRWDTLGAYGNPMEVTPSIDGLAERGTVFERAFTPQPVCGPARACIQTGQYCSTNGVWRNNVVLTDTTDTLATQLAGAGYETGYVGKYHIGGGRDIGDSHVPPERRAGYDGFFRHVEMTGYAGDEREGYLFDRHGNKHHYDGHRINAYTDHALEFLRQDRDDPFFCFLSYFEPHDQPRGDSYLDFEYAPREEYTEQFANPHVPGDLESRPGHWYESLPGYYGDCRQIDDQVGRILDELERQGLREDTVVVFTSDHGCHFTSRGYGENKRTPHDNSIRIPFVVDGPGFRNGGRVEVLVSLIDLAPTVLEAAGLTPSAGMEGTSLCPLVADDPWTRATAREQWRDDVFVQISGSAVERAIRTERWTYAAYDPDADPAEEIESDHYVGHFLYDNRKDPHQRVNLAGHWNRFDESLSEIERALCARLESRIEAVEDRSVTVDPAPYPT